MVFSTGMGSPVSMDSSTVDCPSITRPSTGIFSPGLTRRRLPACTCPNGTSSSDPSGLTLRAVFGARPSSCRIAALVRPRARSSNHSPSNTNATIALATSAQYSSGRLRETEVEKMGRHRNHDHRHGQRHGDPEFPSHAFGFVVVGLLAGHFWFERHAAFRTVAGPDLTDLRMHRTRVDDARGRGRILRWLNNAGCRRMLMCAR